MIICDTFNRSAWFRMNCGVNTATASACVIWFHSRQRPRFHPHGLAYVHAIDTNLYEIIVGARRYRAAKLAQLEQAPVRVVSLSDAACVEAQLLDLSIVGRSFLCLYANSVRRLYVLDVPGLLQIGGNNGMPPPRAIEYGR